MVLGILLKKEINKRNIHYIYNYKDVFFFLQIITLNKKLIKNFNYFKILVFLLSVPFIFIPSDKRRAYLHQVVI
jgi:hypothetical protein